MANIGDEVPSSTEHHLRYKFMSYFFRGRVKPRKSDTLTRNLKKYLYNNKMCVLIGHAEASNTVGSMTYLDI